MTDLEEPAATPAAPDPAVGRRLRASGRRLGPHLPIAPGLLPAVERAAAIGATAFQIFSDNPAAWRRKPEPPADLAAFRGRLSELDMRLAIHGPYLINLAGSEPVLRERSVETLVTELRVAASYGASALNIHIGSHRGQGRDAGLAAVAQGVRRALDAVADVRELPLLVLENSAGGGDGVGSTLEDLADIQEAVAAAGVDPLRIGFCLDTAHLWGAGLGLADADEVDDLVGRVEAIIGPGRLAMLHLNDSRTTYGSRLDRHEHIGAGELGPSVLRAILEHPVLASLPTFLETPAMEEGYDAVNLERTLAVADGVALAPLPPDAFERRPRRAGRTTRSSGRGRATADTDEAAVA